MSKSKQTIKYTATLSERSIGELKALAEKKVIPSVNYAIREAIEEYIVKTKKELYGEQMKKAARDELFMKRTIDSDKDFCLIDGEVDKN